MQVVLASIHPFPSPQAVPLAAACLKAALSENVSLSSRVAVSLAATTLGQPRQAFLEEILALNPDAIGFSIYAWNRAECLEMAAALRLLRPAAILFAGGPEASADAERILSGASLDFIITGEGEATFVEAMARLSECSPVDGLQGIALMRQGSFQSLPRPAQPNPGRFPSPYLSGTLIPGEGDGALWELSRGCSFACEFCFDHKGHAGVRYFPEERITRELQVFAKQKVTQVFVLDSTFNLDIKRAKKILQLIRKAAPHIHFHFEVRSEFIDAELADLFTQITCSLQIGLQSADPLVQQNVGRVFNREDFSSRIGMLNETGAIFGFDLIYGLPGDSLSGFRRSLDFALSLYPNHLDIFPLAVLPGTRLAERADELGLVRKDTAPYTVISSPTFPPADMVIAARLAAACDIFYSRGKAVAWFNSVLQALHLSPSALLGEFALWFAGQQEVRGEDQLNDGQIRQLQRRFLHELFTEKNRQKLVPLVHDLVDYHYYYAAALLSPLPDLPTDRELERTDLLRQPLVLSSSAILARFNYEIIDILEAGEVNLREFAGCFKPCGSFAVIYPRGDDVFTESLIEPYYLLLQHLGSGKPAGDILPLPGLDAEEAISFLEFAAAEGIVTICS
ncbi:radical SAM protein [Geotalea sp. SG265]|uniref:B12-binding domain-containing radical SAM protein n=1 Tax=Geotalea sp. SG265 TaxID=2922867 RepID=UPI001FAEA73F|nr:radical SAM protein [Geotalea sp. SG265]